MLGDRVLRHIVRILDALEYVVVPLRRPRLVVIEDPRATKKSAEELLWVHPDSLVCHVFYCSGTILSKTYTSSCERSWAAFGVVLHLESGD